MRSLQWFPAAVLLTFTAAWAAGCSDDEPPPSSTSTTSASSGGGDGGAGGAGGAGGTGGAMMVCENAPEALVVGTPATFEGTTEGGGDDFSSFCGDTTPASDAPDVVYSFTIPEAGTLTLTAVAASGSSLQPALDVRTVCELAELCAAPANGTATLLGVAYPGTIHVIVDGASGTSGAFELTADLQLAACGDGVVNPGEECDPGAGVQGDPCIDPGQAGECSFIPPLPEQESCPGEVVAVPLGATLLAADEGHFTFGYEDDADGSCAMQMGGDDRVYQLVPAADGMMTVSIGYEADGMTPTCDVGVTLPGCWPRVLYARSDCADPGAEVACALDTLQPMAPESITFPVTAATPVFVFVDGYDVQDYSHGTYNLHLDLQ
jgi:hypothetical protein